RSSPVAALLSVSLKDTTVSSPDMTSEENNLKADLRFFFMSPCEKYRARCQLPWKLCLQLLKIVLVTTQLVLFGLSNHLVASFKEENSLAFKHLFLKGFQGAREDGNSFAVYNRQDVYDSMFYAINQYLQLHNVTVGNYGYVQDENNLTALTVCKQLYVKSPPVPSENVNRSIIDSRIETVSLVFLLYCIGFFRLVQIEISFRLKGIDLQAFQYNELPDCYEFLITITFDNTVHSGIIKIFLDSDAAIQECNDWDISDSLSKSSHYILIFDVFIMLICLMSLILCTRSIILAISLQKRFASFFLRKYNFNVCLSDRLEFLNGWYIMIIISDTMTITGSIMKMEITVKNLTTYDICSILLGTSTLFVWVGVIRYLGYFQKYNVLILTMGVAFPKVLRFCCCAGIIYLGYTFCGWIVLGPYHAKFENLSTVAECLFSLVNGDDMFATFAELQEKSNLLWLFSRLYLYSFISLFIYMILSLFIALIQDTYETIKVSNTFIQNQKVYLFYVTVTRFTSPTAPGVIFLHPFRPLFDIQHPSL
uniref:Mucolipin TRP cation channel 2 n=1 Tax=Callorhinchus milii TaxID=7868 RepID=A0A4W3I985_CALMI